MKNIKIFLNKLNGWQRIWLVLSVLWLILAIGIFSIDYKSFSEKWASDFVYRMDDEYHRRQHQPCFDKDMNFEGGRKYNSYSYQCYPNLNKVELIQEHKKKFDSILSNQSYYLEGRDSLEKEKWQQFIDAAAASKELYEQYDNSLNYLWYVIASIVVVILILCSFPAALYVSGYALVWVIKGFLK